MADFDSSLLRNVRFQMETQLADLLSREAAFESDGVHFHTQLDRLAAAGHVGIEGLYLTDGDMPRIVYSDDPTVERGERIAGSDVLIAKLKVALAYLDSLEKPIGFDTQRKR